MWPTSSPRSPRTGTDDTSARGGVRVWAAPFNPLLLGAGYIERNWPPALKESGAWPLSSLRQSFLNGSLTRLPDPDLILKGKIVEFVVKGDFSLASGQEASGSYPRVWFAEPVGTEEISFEAGVYLLRKDKAMALKAGTFPETGDVTTGGPLPGRDTLFGEETDRDVEPEPGPEPKPQEVTLHLTGSIPPELWNRLGTKLLPKLRSGGANLSVNVEFSVSLPAERAAQLKAEVQQILQELGIADRFSFH